MGRLTCRDVGRHAAGAPQAITMARAKHDFTLRFEAPIPARRRHVGTDLALATLRDAAEFIGALPVRRQSAPYWQYAAELVQRAAESRKPSDILAAEAQLRRALANEGMLRRD